MQKAQILLDPDFVVGPVRRQTFGAFVEHLGRCVYGGIYDPTHPDVTAEGFRKDVLKLVRELGISTVRYPGGNFVSGYKWEDGIGPREKRPRRLDLAWHSTEPNWVGLGEFIAWCRKAEVEPMLAVNLGTRGVSEALELLEYCNHRGDTTLSDLRAANGSPEPFNVRMWCLGNEMDGPWQTGHKTAREYGRLAAETARAMRQIDPELKLVACGSSHLEMPTFGDWEREVLAEAYEQVDYISAHAYYSEKDGDYASFLASAVNLDQFIEAVSATVDAVKVAKGVTKEINISFDEWNVWYVDRAPSQPPTGDDWPIAPALLEDHYSVIDAVVVGNLLISLLRHTDRVHSASLAQLVNVIAPIMTENGGRCWKQTIFHPFAQASNLAKGKVLATKISAPEYHAEAYGSVPTVDAVATFDEDTRELVVFAVSRDLAEETELSVRLGGKKLCIKSVETYANADFTWKASADDDVSVVPSVNRTAAVTDGVVSIVLPPVSWNMIRCAVIY